MALNRDLKPAVAEASDVGALPRSGSAAAARPTGEMPSRRRRASIQRFLLVSLVVVALVPVVIIGVGATVAGVQADRRAAFGQLDTEAALKTREINAWLERLSAGLDAVVAERRIELFMQMLLDPSAGDNEYSRQVLNEHLLEQVEGTGQFQQLLLVDTSGLVIASSRPALAGSFHAGWANFREGLQGFHASFYSPSPNQWVLIAARPVLDELGQPAGILVGYAGMETINVFLDAWVSSGETGKAYLVDRNRTVLTGPHLGDRVSLQTVNAALASQENAQGQYADYGGRLVVGVAHWLPNLDVVLLAEQDTTEAFRGTTVTLLSNAGATLAAVLFAVLVSVFVARRIAAPLVELAEAASQIAAGDLERVVALDRDDEIGVLARNFNAMTARLADLVGSLEGRVAERTQELERRSLFVEASAEVGHAASAILEPDRLIQQVVELIQERFGLYYVGLFLLDSTRRWAVLRAGTGEAGRAMLARRHRIRVGEGMIGWSIANAEARIALEADEDVVRLVSTELPETRSEAALPLRSRGQVIGALTVQSDQPGAFDESAIAVLQTMADQVAVAIDNARLFDESRESLEAARRAYGEISREAWVDLLRGHTDLGYRSDERGVSKVEGFLRPEMERCLREGAVVQGDDVDDPAGDESASEERRTLAVPIKVRGDVIGALDTYKPADAGEWTSEEIELLEEMAEQLGLALESARLHMATQRRAVRERLAAQITDKMRRASNAEEIVRTAVDELLEALGTSRAFVRLESTPSSSTDGAGSDGGTTGT